MRSEIKLIYRLTSDNDDLFSSVSKLKIQPDKTWKKGDLIDNRTLVKYKTNGISFSSYEESSNKFEAHVDSLIGILSPIKGALKKLSASCHSELSCVIYIYGDDRPAMHIDKKVLRFFSNLNTDIDVDLYTLNQLTI